MSVVKQYRYFMCDFETTVYKGQKYTEVWAAGAVELFTEDCIIVNSIQKLYAYFISLNCNVIAYFHNLKFDGAFWLSFLLQDRKYKQALIKTGSGEYDLTFADDKEMRNKEFKYSISDRGQFYTITIKVNNHFIIIRDSLKLLPFSVENIGKSFGTKHKKLDMEYEGVRHAGGVITDEEKEYLKNDLLVPKEALEIMFKDGHNKLTIGSCCLAEYKQICKKSLKNVLSYDEMFPDLTAIDLNSEVYNYTNVDKYIRKSYRGGWCYYVKGKEGKVYKGGVTADVNSLYPSVMHSESGNKYPIGKPAFWSGNYIPKEAIGNNKYYFVRIKTRFYIKKGYLPFLQIKGNPLYPSTDCLESSDIWDSEKEAYVTHYPGEDDLLHDTRVVITMTMTDYELFKEHYNLVDFEILDGCYFYAMPGIFDEYIDKYKKIKMNSKGATREEAKLFLNNLYGKLASSDNSSFKVAYVKDDGSIGFYAVSEHNKKSGYIACGSAITSYARNFTIRAAQKNYHGVDKPGFIYADTDSIHCDLKPEEIVGIKIHPTNFCCWKLESRWDIGIFVRQKTYIEHVVEADLYEKDGKYSGEEVEPYYNVKCAGMPDSCKNLFIMSMYKGEIEYIEKKGNKKPLTKEQKEFLYDKNNNRIVRTVVDFKRGLRVPGKLMPKRILGGIVLNEGYYEMR